MLAASASWMPAMIKLALPVSGFRRGLLGTLPVGPEYMAGVRARARMLARACRVKRVGVTLPADARQLQLQPDEKK